MLVLNYNPKMDLYLHSSCVHLSQRHSFINGTLVNYVTESIIMNTNETMGRTWDPSGHRGERFLNEASDVYIQQTKWNVYISRQYLHRWLSERDSLSWWPPIGAPTGGAGLVGPGEAVGMRPVIYGLSAETNTAFPHTTLFSFLHRLHCDLFYFFNILYCQFLTF